MKKLAYLFVVNINDIRRRLVSQKYIFIDRQKLFDIILL